MAETDLPEDVILNILSWLPVKSLIRFTSVSKRFRSIILYDPKFARTQFEAACQRKTLSCLLIFHTLIYRLESLDLDTPSYGDISSGRKLSFPFEQPGSAISLLGSCNGLVFVAFDDVDFYIWNPANRFFLELPKPDFSEGQRLRFYGAGYLSATEDYKVFAASEEMKMFSLRAHVWKTIQHPGHYRASNQGTLLNEAIHWVNDKNQEILAFDFAQEEFRTMRLPDHDPCGVNLDHVGVYEGCLCVCGHQRRGFCISNSVDFWVMREYDVYDSWTKLFNFSYSSGDLYTDFLVTGSRSVAVKWGGKEWSFVKIDHKEEKELLMYTTRRSRLARYHTMIPCEESLLRINY